MSRNGMIILIALICAATACVVTGHEDAAGGFVFAGVVLAYFGVFAEPE